MPIGGSHREYNEYYYAENNSTTGNTDVTIADFVPPSNKIIEKVLISTNAELDIKIFKDTNQIGTFRNSAALLTINIPLNIDLSSSEHLILKVRHYYSVDMQVSSTIFYK